MKKFVSSLLVLCVLTLATTQRADATIGFMMSSKATKAAGGLLMGGSVVSAGVGSALNIVYGSTSSAVMFTTLGVLGVWLGIIILDEKSGDLNFNPITSQSAKKLNISQSELEIYNSEIDELNAVKEVIESQMSVDATQAEVAELWNDYKANLSPETMKVASKIVTEVFNNKVEVVK